MNSKKFLSEDLIIEKEGQRYSWPSFSQKDFELLQRLFSEVYDFFDVDKAFDIVLTSSHEESLTHVILSHYFQQMFQSGQTQIVTTECITSAQREALDRLKRFGIETVFVEKNDRGLISLESLEKCVSLKTSMISIPWAHPITGIIQPLHDIAALAQKRNIFLHVDMSLPALKQLEMSLKSLKIDYLTFHVGEEDNRPCYTSGVIAAPQADLMPLIAGYGIQKLRGGLFSLDRLKNLVEILQKIKDDRYDHLLKFSERKKRFLQEVKQRFPQSLLFLQDVETLPSIVVASLAPLHAEYMSYVLSQKAIAASLGGYKYPALKHLLSFSKISEMDKQSALSFDLDALLEIDDKDVIDQMLSCIESIGSTFQSKEKI